MMLTQENDSHILHIAYFDLAQNEMLLLISRLPCPMPRGFYDDF